MKARSRSDAPDLQTQLESMLDQVWQSEADWRLWDRLDAAIRFDEVRERRRKRHPDIDKAA